jgi:hypothetical protein
MGVKARPQHGHCHQSYSAHLFSLATVLTHPHCYSVLGHFVEIIDVGSRGGR